jgi:hypothetical protein
MDFIQFWIETRMARAKFIGMLDESQKAEAVAQFEKYDQALRVQREFTRRIAQKRAAREEAQKRAAREEAQKRAAREEAQKRADEEMAQRLAQEFAAMEEAQKRADEEMAQRLAQEFADEEMAQEFADEEMAQEFAAREEALRVQREHTRMIAQKRADEEMAQRLDQGFAARKEAQKRADKKMAQRLDQENKQRWDWQPGDVGSLYPIEMVRKGEEFPDNGGRPLDSVLAWLGMERKQKPSSACLLNALVQVLMVLCLSESDRSAISAKVKETCRGLETKPLDSTRVAMWLEGIHMDATILIHSHGDEKAHNATKHRSGNSVFVITHRSSHYTSYRAALIA